MQVLSFRMIEMITSKIVQIGPCNATNHDLLCGAFRTEALVFT